jgi:Na+-driven multidrug efflux pump
MLDQRGADKALNQDKEPFTKMLWQIARVALPASITMVFSMLMDLVNMIFVGHLNDSAKVAGVGLGNMYVNIVS